MNVYIVESAGGPGENTVAVEFKLAVEGEPPAGATFFGYLGYSRLPFSLRTRTAMVSIPAAHPPTWYPPEMLNQP